MAAILAYDATLISADAQAYLARNLVACETKPGGPYTTWLVAPDTNDWRDVDVAVNANVGLLLARLGVVSEPLESYISDCIEKGEMTSPYYIGSVPILYFVSRWYRGSQQDHLKVLVKQQLELYQPPLFIAMLVTAACNLDHASIITPKILRSLLDSQLEGGWPASPLYYEPPEQGAWRYAGSAELTTAFAVEALQLWLNSQAAVEQVTINSVPTNLAGLYAQRVLELKTTGRIEVLDPAGVIARALGFVRKRHVIEALNEASINGWVAYTIYDDFLDNEGNPRYLGVANVAMLQALSSFSKALPTNRYYARFVIDTFEKVDAANTWEVVNARDPDNLPAYGNLHQLADRSWGHVLAPTGTMLAAGFSLGSPEVKMLHGFMRHYIIAKQLADDAHDWQEDLRCGRISAVVAMLLRGCGEESDDARQLYFWQHTILDVNKHILRHLRRAQGYLDRSHVFIDKTELQEWLISLEKICAQVEQGRKDALDFIATFTSSNLVN